MFLFWFCCRVGAGNAIHHISDGGPNTVGFLATELIVNATRCPPRPAKGPATGDRQPATGSKLHKAVELLISQVFYRQNGVYNIGVVNIGLVFKAK